MPVQLPAVRPRSLLPAAALGGALLLGLAGCSAGGAPAGPAPAPGETLTVVATTSVYADVAREVGGDAVAVDAVIDSTAQDPHSYEATAQDLLAVRDADLVILNGGGYDPFMADLAAQGGAPVVDAVGVSGPARAPGGAGEGTGEHGPGDHGEAEHGPGGANEHVWYDLDSMAEVARAVADRLAELDPGNADAYHANAEAFAAELAALKQRVAGAAPEGTAFVATEPVAVYLLEDAGLHDDTPAEFTAAVENGTDVPPLVLHRVRELLEDGHVQLLAFNAQTASGQTEQLRDDARAAGAAVVEFTETLPEGTGYLEWMDGNVTAVVDALAGLRPSAAGTGA